MAMKILLICLLAPLIFSGCATNMWAVCGQDSVRYVKQQMDCQATPYNNCNEVYYFVMNCKVKEF
jgi:hypothetical protein